MGRIKKAGTLALVPVLLSACANSEAIENEVFLPVETEVVETMMIPQEMKKTGQLIYEAEEAALSGGVKKASDEKGYLGTGYVTGFTSSESKCTFVIDIAISDHYDLNFVSSGIGGEKYNGVVIDGAVQGEFKSMADQFSDALLTRIYLEEGMHTVEVTNSWGWINLDRLELIPSEEVSERLFNVSNELINPNASERTQGLMNFLVESYGKVIISGQYADQGVYSNEFTAIKEATGKMPAMLGLDLMDYTPSRVAFGTKGKAVTYAKEFDAMGGIISLCWHWNAPEPYLYNNSKQKWWSGFYTEATNIDLAKIMNGKDQEGYDLLLRDIDAIAEELKALQDADVPLLWRPLHEASGGWFWWGAAGQEAYKALWVLLYERLTYEHGLNNLIWVWNGQDKAWYPGDDYVDIIGEDIYPGEKVYTSQSSKFMEAVNYSETPKIVALTENGCLIDPDLAFLDDARWAWFGIWNGEFMIKANSPVISGQYNEEDMVKKVYQHEKVLTLDELPDLKNYALE